MTGVVTLMLSLGLLACTRPYQAPMPLDGQELVRVRLRADLSNHLSLGTPGLRVAVSDAGPSCPHRVPAGQRIERGSVVLLPGAG